MRHLIRLFLVLGVATLVSGCQTGFSGSGAAPSDGVTENAVLGTDIEVTALDAPSLDPAASAPPPEAASTAASQEAPPAPAAASPTPLPAPQPDLTEGSESSAEAPSETPAEAAPEAPKSDAQIACEKKRGQWLSTGVGQLRTCVFTTRDGGKRCRRESDCEGQCLARSGTCSPIRPLLGCNEILQDNGVRVTQCIE
jgi:hypothetical protein